MADSEHFHNLTRGGIPRQLAEGLSARVFPREHLMLSVVEITAGSVSPVHAHPNEQWGVCLEGEWIRIQDGVEHHVKAGDFWQTPPHVPHGGRTLDRRCIVLDIFARPRQAYDLARCLPRSEFEVAVAGPRDGPFFDRFRALGLTVAEVPTGRLGP